MRIRELPSPNHGPRPEGARIALVVLHYTGMASAHAAISRLRDPESGVSAHYVIGEDGEVLRLVPEERRAWHAGSGAFAGFRDVNDVSIGIELVHPGHDFGYRPFARAQIRALAWLLEDLLARHRLPARAVIAHSDLAPHRKRDPGEFFPWAELARCGLAFFPEDPGEPRPPDWAEALGHLRSIGYAPGVDGITPARALRAFQRRFFPQRVDGVLDARTMGRLAAVARAAAPQGQATSGGSDIRMASGLPPVMSPKRVPRS